MSRSVVRLRPGLAAFAALSAAALAVGCASKPAGVTGSWVMETGPSDVPEDFEGRLTIAEDGVWSFVLLDEEGGIAHTMAGRWHPEEPGSRAIWLTEAGSESRGSGVLDDEGRLTLTADGEAGIFVRPE